MNNSNSIGCVKEATKILGDKWTPQLLRFFLNNDSLRFCQLETLADKINPRTLSARLASMEEEGIISKINTNDSSRCEYKITQKGADLAPIIQSMQAWSDKYSNINV